MFRKYILFMFGIQIFLLLDHTIAQVCEYEVPKINSNIILDALQNVSTDGYVWGLASSYLSSYATPRDGWTWSDWLETSESQNEIWVIWEAVWNENKIYIFVTMEDNKLDGDHYNVGNPNPNLFEDDDCIHLLFYPIKNIIPDIWNWTDDHSNYLIHNRESAYCYKRINNAGDFMTQINDASTGFAFGHSNPELSETTWRIESSIESTDGNNYNSTYMQRDYVWFNLVYNDADFGTDETGKIIRSRSLVWCAKSQDNEPCDNLGKLILLPEDVPINFHENYRMSKKAQNSTVTKFKTILNNTDNDVKINGVLEEAKQYPRIIFTSSRKTDQSDSLWQPWDKFSDAAVIWRAFWNSNENFLYMAFEIFDDYKDTSDFNLSQNNKIEDDGLQLWIDFNNDSTYKEGTDINILIHNKGSIYKIAPGIEEKYITPDSSNNIEVAVGQLGAGFNNWIAEIKVKLPGTLFNENPDSILHIDIGYNDADTTLIRKNQLVWSNVTANILPWRDFEALGKFRLTKAKSIPITSTAASYSNLDIIRTVRLFQNYPNPFNSETNISFLIKQKSHATMKIYNMLGKHIITLLDKVLVPGDYQIHWDGYDSLQNPVASGIYFAVLQVDNFRLNEKIVLIR